MPITSVSKDPEALTMTVTAEFPVPVQRLWDAYADPRQLEKFWGPVEWPATFTRHDFATGGRSDYYMTGPEGERSAGYWKYLAVAPGKSFEVEDGFAFAQLSKRRGVAAAERREDGALRQAGRLGGVVQVGRHRITATRTARPTARLFAFQHLQRCFGVLLAHRSLHVVVHDLLSNKPVHSFRRACRASRPWRTR